MLQIDLLSVTAEDLQRLVDVAMPEGPRLEFKRQLNLTTKSEKRELAKDVSGLANSSGGRIVYGIDEETREGLSVAAALTPLADQSEVPKVDDIIADCIHPRPRYRHHAVDVDGGVILIVEVRPATGADLFMVSSLGEHRYYKRENTRVSPMTEAEVRESYFRIAASRRDLDESMGRLIESEEEARSQALESVYVVPLYSQPMLVDPRHEPHLGQSICDAIRPLLEQQASGPDFEITGSGFRGLYPYDEPAGSASTYWAVRRSGLIHRSDMMRFNGDPRGDVSRYRADRTLRNLLQALSAASVVYKRFNYFGSVRVLHRLRVSGSLALRTERERFRFDEEEPRLLPAGVSDHVVHEIGVEDLDDPVPIVRDLLDQIWQHFGQPRCDWFESDGSLIAVRQHQLGLPPLAPQS